QSVETFELGDGPVAVYNLAGTVEVVSGSGSEVRVEVERRGADGGALTMDVDRIRGREALRVRYPSDRIVYADAGRHLDTNVRVDDDGTFFDGERGATGWLSRLFDGDRVEIRDSGRGLEAWAHVRVLLPAGSDVATYLAVGETRVEGVDGDVRLETGQGRVDARDTRGSLLIDTGSGPVTVVGAEGEVNVDTGSGSVDVRDVIGDVLVDTGSGSVQVDGAEGEVSIDTGSGSVDVTNVSGRALRVDTGSGSVDGSGLSVESLDVDTGSGSVRLDRMAARRLGVDTGSGRVSVELLDDTESVVVDTGSGGVTLAFAGAVGSVAVDTGSGSVDLTVTETAGARLVLDAGGRAEVDSGLLFEPGEARRGYLEGRLGDGSGRVHVETGSGSIRVRGS
ncbi:MAG: DUF4097 family beta strand repeat-containing protein, partial [Longimicrobiales bacterium]|nr:DUF4097 family beta strand repeat-containing protein [Longimicrobiales bacterium]